MQVIGLENRNIEATYPSGWLFVAILAAAIALLGGVVTGDLMTFLDAVVIAMIGFIVVTNLGVWMSRPIDAQWLPGMIAAGYLAKILASVARYLVLVIIYHGSGDAAGYHGSGVTLVEYWRSFQVPPGMTIGTGFVDGFTGLVYVPYVPQMLGGFFMYSTLAFFGQMLMYAAFRDSAKPRRLKWYSAAIFFIPAITYWPASLGKESLMFLGIGLAVYGASLFMRHGGVLPLLYLGAGLAFAGAIRPHVSALILGAMATTLVIAKGKGGLGLPSFQRWTAVIVIGTASLGLVAFAASEFNINLSGDIGSEVDEFVTNLEDNTAKGGSEVEGGAVSSPLDIPGAALRVLFRPLPYEAHNLQAMASALESATILLVFLWRSPKILKNLRRSRDDPYVIMSVVMTFGFIIMFSPFLNLGLLARERSQILPFLAVMIVQLGWNFAKEDDQVEQPPSTTGRLQPIR